MTTNKTYDVIIIGGSYAGLSAAMSLGRSLRRVLVIDSGKPCNRQTPHSHNFLTHDGQEPGKISAIAKQQVSEYDAVEFYDGLANTAVKTENGFDVQTQSGEEFAARKLIFATGLKDIMPDIKGFAECWGISILHCPYCHGYEVKNQKTGIIANGDVAFHYAQLISNWTKELLLFTNEKSNLTDEQTATIRRHNIQIVEKKIVRFEHSDGNIRSVIFKDGTQIAVNAIYSRPDFVQHCAIPEKLGCEMTEQGHIKTDMLQRTTVEGVYAAGDNATMLRAVSVAVSNGTIAGASVNHDLINEEF